MPGESGALWYDDDAGPMVRPYTVTRGRTLPPGRAPRMDVIAVVVLAADHEPGVTPDAGVTGFGATDVGASGSGVPDAGATDSGVSGAGALSGDVASGTAVLDPAFPDTAAVGGHGTRPRADALGEEHLALLEHCRPGPLSVADLAAEADLPLGVVRVLLADLVDLGRVRITRPVAPAELPDIDLLTHLISGLKSL